jgi:hypothetical protein
MVLGGIVGALAMGITAAAYAAVPIPGADGKIRACVKYEDINKYEQMRWITKTTCPKGEKLIAWNAKGVQGPKGEKGDKGDPGTPGADGEPGVNKAYEDYEINTSHPLGYQPEKIFEIDVPSGTYAVTATVVPENFHDDDTYVACNINHWTGSGGRIIKLKGHSSQVMTVMKVTGPSLDDPGKITLICGGLPQSDELNAAEFHSPQIMAIKIE